MIICNAFVSQLFWFRKIRTNLTALFVISIFINIGMWFERYVIIAQQPGQRLRSLGLAGPGARPGRTGASCSAVFGWFGMYFLLFARTFPVVAIQEIKEMIPMPRKRGGALMATRKVPGVLASFVHIDAACDAIAVAARRRDGSDFTVYSAAPNHEIEEALGITNSPVRLFTLIGGLTGCAAGFGMTIWMSRDWPLLVGGKPIAPIPPYVVHGLRADDADRRPEHRGRA